MCKQIVTSDEFGLWNDVGEIISSIFTSILFDLYLSISWVTSYAYNHEFWLVVNFIENSMQWKLYSLQITVHNFLDFSTKIVRILFSVRNGALLCLQVFYSFCFESALPSSQVTFLNLDAILAAHLRRPGQTFERTKIYVTDTYPDSL